MCLTNLSVNMTQNRDKLDITAQGRAGNNAKQLVLRRRRRGGTLTLTVTTNPVPDMCAEDVRCVFTNIELQQQLPIPEGVRRVRVKNANGDLIDSLDVL